jgi:PAS domain S-box-containing protein
VFELADFGLAHADALNNTFLEVNPAYARQRGYAPEELVGRSLMTVYAPGDQEKALRFTEQVDATGHGVLESVHVRKDGSIFWGHITVGLIRDEKGKPLYYTPLLQNIDDLKQAEGILQESEEKYRNLVERANDGICLFQDKLIKYANPRLAEIWGGSVQEILNTPFTDHVYPDDLHMIIERYNRRMAGEKIPTSYEAGIKRKEAARFTLS